MLLLCAFGWATSQAQVRVTCVGNSITEGYALNDPANEAYPACMQRLLGEGFVVTNCGLSGYTALDKTDAPYMHPDAESRQAFQDALESQPDIITIKLGTNDSKVRYDSLLHADFTRDLNRLIDAFVALPSHPKIFLCLPVPAFSDRWTIRDSVIQGEVIPRIMQVAEERKLPVIDLYTPLKPFGELFPDGIHPNRAGAMIIAEEITRRLLLEQKKER